MLSESFENPFKVGRFAVTTSPDTDSNFQSKARWGASKLGR
jgi:hypothetical protein